MRREARLAARRELKRGIGFRDRWRELSFDEHWLLVTYLTTPIWSVAMILFPPTANTLVGLVTIYSIAVVPLLGVIPAAAGVWFHNNLIVELPGAMLRYAGALAFFALQIFLASDHQERISLACLILVLVLVPGAARLHYLSRLFIRRIIRGRP